MNDELVERFFRGHLSSLTCGKLDKGTLLPLHYGYGADLPKLVEMVPEKKIFSKSEFQLQPQDTTSVYSSPDIPEL